MTQEKLDQKPLKQALNSYFESRGLSDSKMDRLLSLQENHQKKSKVHLNKLALACSLAIIGYYGLHYIDGSFNHLAKGDKVRSLARDMTYVVQKPTMLVNNVHTQVEDLESMLVRNLPFADFAPVIPSEYSDTKKYRLIATDYFLHHGRKGVLMKFLSLETQIEHFVFELEDLDYGIAHPMHTKIGGKEFRFWKERGLLVSTMASSNNP